ncbi:MAG TPA: hypothetical protein VMF66_01945 [Candidatus Acidoferrum sp.]|nr:hypothetical protein [Candidatus Acidoferrum sp.]
MRADTTYTVSQTFNIDSQTINGCGPAGSPQCTAATGTITGTITTDGNSGVLSSTDITGFNLTLGYGSDGSDIVDGENGGTAEVIGNALYATSTGLFFTTGSGGGTITFVEGNGHDIFESLSNPICLSSPCTISDPALSFFLEAGPGSGNVTGSDPLTTAIVPIATVTPEPATAVLYLLGFALIVLLRKRLAFLS